MEVKSIALPAPSHILHQSKLLIFISFILMLGIPSTSRAEYYFSYPAIEKEYQAFEKPYYHHQYRTSRAYSCGNIHRKKYVHTQKRKAAIVHQHKHVHKKRFYVQERVINLQFQTVHKLRPRDYYTYNPDMTTGDDNPRIHPEMNIDY